MWILIPIYIKDEMNAKTEFLKNTEENFPLLLRASFVDFATNMIINNCLQMLLKELVYVSRLEQHSSMYDDE